MAHPLTQTRPATSRSEREQELDGQPVAVATPEPVVRNGLDWQGFVDAYFPGSRRHDLRAITAYAASRRSCATDGRADARHEATSTVSTPIDAWEDEGGAA
jgi:hypothetical protein